MKLLLILAWFYCCFVKLDLGAFEGSSDPWKKSEEFLVNPGRS